MAAGISASSSAAATEPQEGPLARATAGLVPYAPTILRVVVGFVFLQYGLNKLGNPDGFAGFVGSLGFPAQAAFAWFIIGLEILGGVALIIGILVRPVALLFAIEMLVTSWLVKLPRGIAPSEGGAGLELDIVMLAAAVALLILGAGRLSIDRDVIRRELI
jgi:putative oxidoreductase